MILGDFTMELGATSLFGFAILGALVYIGMQVSARLEDVQRELLRLHRSLENLSKDFAIEREAAQAFRDQSFRMASMEVEQPAEEPESPVFHRSREIAPPTPRQPATYQETPRPRNPVQTLLELYNTVDRDPDSEESWNLEFQHRGGRTLGVTNASDRLRDPTIDPIFKVNENGYLDILPTGDRPDEFLAFPRTRLRLDRNRWSAGGLAVVYLVDGPNLVDGGDATFEIIRPARMIQVSRQGEYQIDKPGLLRFRS